MVRERGSTAQPGCRSCSSLLAPHPPTTTLYLPPPRPLAVDVRLELNPDEASKEVLYDEASKTVRIPLAALNDGQRRTKMVMFTCNKCGEWG